jgi:hypothetical protein
MSDKAHKIGPGEYLYKGQLVFRDVPPDQRSRVAKSTWRIEHATNPGSGQGGFERRYDAMRAVDVAAEKEGA